ncbi:hypothetical protein Dsin_001753 [Dipteronia sinensis]|uniref:Uncharacterized protein n=1 Tax=Dipteronia sinensis TaxID=43782 RepID=A0AAE0B5V9_9ROSI|nr:hypothetical protein Dsin_001753 [Dipteronia sinensis]
MMATSGPAYRVPTVSVVGEGFCVPYPVELIVKRKTKGLSDMHFEVLDINGNLFLQVDGTSLSFQCKRVMHNPAGFPILTLREKALTALHRWTVHRGEGSELHNLHFSVKDLHAFQLKTRLDVFLPNNFNEDISNFKVVGRYSSESFKVFKGETVIAEVNHNFTWESFCKGIETFKVKVYPGVDYAFIVALIVIVNENDDI